MYCNSQDHFPDLAGDEGKAAEWSNSFTWRKLLQSVCKVNCGDKKLHFLLLYRSLTNFHCTNYHYQLLQPTNIICSTQNLSSDIWGLTFYSDLPGFAHSTIVKYNIM
uniref:Uncharacterized protein n=1 Tax=Homalodisca liturata TaxID=320908 RepID=A0A1B6HZS6_9HEMI